MTANPIPATLRPLRDLVAVALASLAAASIWAAGLAAPCALPCHSCDVVASAPDLPCGHAGR